MPVSEASNQPRSRPSLATLLWKTATGCIRWQASQSRAGLSHKARWHLQGSLAGLRGEGYCHTCFTDEDGGAHAGLWPAPGHPLTSALPDPPQRRESRCQPLCRAAPRPTPSDRTATCLAPSLLLGPGLVPATQGAPGLRAGREGQQVCVGAPRPGACGPPTPSWRSMPGCPEASSHVGALPLNALRRNFQKFPHPDTHCHPPLPAPTPGTPSCTVAGLHSERGRPGPSPRGTVFLPRLARYPLPESGPDQTPQKTAFGGPHFGGEVAEDQDSGVQRGAPAGVPPSPAPPPAGRDAAWGWGCSDDLGDCGLVSSRCSAGEPGEAGPRNRFLKPLL